MRGLAPTAGSSTFVIRSCLRGCQRRDARSIFFLHYARGHLCTKNKKHQGTNKSNVHSTVAVDSKLTTDTFSTCLTLFFRFPRRRARMCAAVRENSREAARESDFRFSAPTDIFSLREKNRKEGGRFSNKQKAPVQTEGERAGHRPGAAAGGGERVASHSVAARSQSGTFLARLRLLPAPHCAAHRAVASY